jgi:hypothetical protein
MNVRRVNPWATGTLLWVIAVTAYCGLRCSAQEPDDAPPPAAGAAADTEAESASPDAAPPVKKFRRRLPAYFSAVVTPSQRQKIYEIQEGYFNKILALEEQVRKLQKQRDAEIDGLLMPDQLEEVNQKRAAAANRRRTPAPDAAEAGETS